MTGKAICHISSSCKTYIFKKKGGAKGSRDWQSKNFKLGSPSKYYITSFGNIALSCPFTRRCLVQGDPTSFIKLAIV